MFLSMVILFWKEHTFMQECDVSGRRYYMCSDVYNSHVRLFDEAFNNRFSNGISP